MDKGAGFTIPKLIHNDHLMRVSSYTLGIFRLAHKIIIGSIHQSMELLKVLNILMVSIIPLTQWRFDRNWMYLGKMSGPLLQSKQKILEIYTLLLLVL